MNFLAAGRRQAGDDDFNAAVFGGDFFQQSHHGVFIGFHGENQAVIGIILVEQGLDIAVGIVVHAFDRQNDRDPGVMFAGFGDFNGAGGNTGKADSKALGNAAGPDRENDRGRPNPE